MIRALVSLIALCLGAATCAKRPAPDQDPAKPVPPPPPAKEATVPAGYALEHFGDGEAFKLLVAALHPELAKAWGEGSIGVLRRGDHRCAISRQGPNVTPIVPCEQGPEGATQVLPLAPTLFGLGMSDGWVAASPRAGFQMKSADLARALAPLVLPDVDLPEQVLVNVEARADGSGQAIALELGEDAIERIARFDLRRRYGANNDYVGSVRAWGDGKHYQWITKLEGGGAGLRLDGRKLRIAVQAGAAWQDGLDQLLRSPGDALGPFPSLLSPELVLRLDEARGWTIEAAEKPLPTAGLLRQLAARLRRWRAPKETP